MSRKLGILSTAAVAALSIGLMSAPASAAETLIGLITKTNTNPFFVKMREGAQTKAKELGVTLQAYAGKFDGDNDGEVAAIEALMNAGAKGILLVPSDSTAIVPTVENIAIDIWNRIAPGINGRARLYSVRVHETSELWVEYRGPQ